jgi:hypothetical protein
MGPGRSDIGPPSRTVQRCTRPGAFADPTTYRGATCMGLLRAPGCRPRSAVHRPVHRRRSLQFGGPSFDDPPTHPRKPRHGRRHRRPVPFADPTTYRDDTSPTCRPTDPARQQPTRTTPPPTCTKRHRNRRHGAPFDGRTNGTSLLGHRYADGSQPTVHPTWGLSTIPDIWADAAIRRVPGRQESRRKRGSPGVGDWSRTNPDRRAKS